VFGVFGLRDLTNPESLLLIHAANGAIASSSEISE
jgi:hypothetical protein